MIMLTEEQLEERRSAVGGSDLAAILGVDPYKQAIDIFYDKRPDLVAEHGFVPRVVEGMAADRGNLFEEPIAKLYEIVTGKKVRKSHVRHVHDKHPWLAANIDRTIVGEPDSGLEIKSVTHYLARLWGDSGTDEVAEYYLPQVHQYMLVLDKSMWELAALIGVDDLRIYDIARDPEMDELIIDVTHDFWHNNVLKGVPPEVDMNHKRVGDLLKRMHPGTNGEEITLDEEAAHWHHVMLEAKKKASEYEAAAKCANNHLKLLAGDASKIRIPGVKGAYVRREINKDGFFTKPQSYIDFRYSPGSK